MRDHDRPLWSLSASELSAAYANGLSPRDAVESTLAHIGDVNPQLNAIVTPDETGARRSADDSAKRWSSGRPASPLDGVPVTVKDNILVAGMRATWGSQLYSAYVPDRDETPVRRLREAGAVILGKTNVPEFTLHGFTDNLVFGTTGNPWDPTLTPGGSSGGAVASVASGMGAIALATDGGGSIRRPAAHTGLIGFKPSRNSVPRGDGFPAILHNFQVIGPIARCVADIILGMDVISGPGWTQSNSKAGLKQPRIVYAPSFNDAPVDPFIRDTVDKTIERARSLGLDIETVSPFHLADPLDAIWPIISKTGVAWLLEQHGDWERKVSPAIAEMAAAGQKFTARDYLNALDTIATLSQTFEHLFERYDFLMTPTTAAMPWPAKQSRPGIIDGQSVGPRGHAVFTPFANALGLPAISLPCPVDGDALPVGIQIIAAQDEDRALLEFARAHEDRLFLHRWPPAFRSVRAAGGTSAPLP